MYLKKLIIVLSLNVCILLFCAWTPYNNYEEKRYTEIHILSTQASETVNFTFKDDSVQAYTEHGCPNYLCVSGLSNACGAVSGSEIVAFYDKYYPNLIPDWNSAYASGKYRLQDSVYVPSVMRELYTLMRPNVDDDGVSEKDYLNGLKSYVNKQGYNIEYENVVSGRSVDYESCKTAFTNNKVIALLSDPDELYEISPEDTKDNIRAYSFSDPHIMVAYGYVEIKYYNSTGLFRTDIYFEVTSGLNVPKKAFYKINPHNLTAAYIININ